MVPRKIGRSLSFSAPGAVAPTDGFARGISSAEWDAKSRKSMGRGGVVVCQPTRAQH